MASTVGGLPMPSSMHATLTTSLRRFRTTDAFASAGLGPPNLTSHVASDIAAGTTVGAGSQREETKRRNDGLRPVVPEPVMNQDDSLAFPRLPEPQFQNPKAMPTRAVRP